MLESIMLIALGFLTATLFALIAIQFVWRRAIKVTTHKLISELDLDELKASADRVASLNVSLREKTDEAASLSRQNTQLEENITTARQEIETLNQNIAGLQAEHTKLKAEAETHLHDLETLQSHVSEIEAALRVDFEKRGVMETQLKALGAKTLQLLEEMNRAVTDFGNTGNIQTLLEAAPAPTIKPEAAPKLTPPILDDAEKPGIANPASAIIDEPKEIKPSLDQHTEVKSADVARADTNSNTTSDDENDDASLATNENYIADRIRALEAGVNAPA